MALLRQRMVTIAEKASGALGAPHGETQACIDALREIRALAQKEES